MLNHSGFQKAIATTLSVASLTALSVLPLAKPAEAQFRLPTLPRNNPISGFRPYKFVPEYPVNWNEANKLRRGFLDLGYASRYCKQEYNLDYRNSYCGSWKLITEETNDKEI